MHETAESASTTQARPALRVEHLARTYPGRRGQDPRRAIDDLSLSIAPGEWVALLGPNGSGKSTLVRILATLDRPDEGRVTASGRDLGDPANLAAYRRELGVVFQHAGLDKLLTIRENLAAQAALHALTGKHAAEAIARVADILKIADRMRDRIGELSGGLARRADLARALLPSPTLLILDEATTGLDHDSRIGFLDQLAALHQSGQTGSMTIVMTTHLMDEAERAARVVMMHEGKVVLEGTPAALREGVGGTSVRCPASSEAAERILHDAGIASTIRGRERIALASSAETSDTIARIASQLAHAGIAFEISPPTLGDAYLAATGATLTDLSGDAA
jgi:ABC-2 type transport system ATP-binding protein